VRIDKVVEGLSEPPCLIFKHPLSPGPAFLHLHLHLFVQEKQENTLQQNIALTVARKYVRQ